MVKRKSDNEKIPLNNPILQREMRMQCLRCGKSIMDMIHRRAIRLHFCNECRRETMDAFIKTWMGEKK